MTIQRMKRAACLLLLSLLLTPAIALARDCDDVGKDGQTMQQQLDAVLTMEADAPDSMPEEREIAHAARLYFDSLCRMDARIGTREGSRFLDQETDRLGRLIYREEKLQKLQEQQNAVKAAARK
jgi:hypothetical protein